MKRSVQHITLLLSIAILLVGCNKAESLSDGYEMTFTAHLADISTKASTGLYEDTDLSSLGEFKVTGYDSDDKLFTDRSVYFVNNLWWKFKDNPTIWLREHYMTFWAQANIPSWATVSSSTKASASFAVTEIPSSSSNHADPLIGYYSGTGNSGTADIAFYHPFTAVTFKTGKVNSYVTGINSVKLSGVYKSATATVTGSSTSLTYNWTKTGTTSVSGDFNSGKSANPFILIPQNVSGNNVKITVAVSLSDGGTKNIDVDLDTGDWQSGIIYLYTLDYISTKPMEGTLKVTLSDWGYLPDSGKTFFDADFDK